MPDPNWVREYQDGEVVPGTSYCVIRLIGAGGMGSVYEVEHIELGRRYVLKSLLSTLTTRQDLSARMRNEWRALGQIKHPNIVDISNAGTTTTGVPYYVMELLSGETVREQLEREGHIPSGEAVQIARAVLCGLQAAHTIGVVHRDVKPANVFLERNGGIKLLDFGIAKVHIEGAPKITIKGLAVGTPRYMSPEQAAGERADSRSDVYAVGLLLFEMLTGDGPFRDAQDHAEQMDAHLHMVPPLVSAFVEVPEGLAEVVARTLEKNPDMRPQTASELADALAPYAPPVPPDSSSWAPSASIPPPPMSAGQGAGVGTVDAGVAGDPGGDAGSAAGPDGAPTNSVRGASLGDHVASGAGGSASAYPDTVPLSVSAPASPRPTSASAGRPSGPHQGRGASVRPPGRASVGPTRAGNLPPPAPGSDERVLTTGTIIGALIVAVVIVGTVLTWATRPPLAAPPPSPDDGPASSPVRQ